MNKIDLILDNVDYIIGKKYLNDILDHRNLKIYWGTTVSSIPNINYLIPLIKLGYFIKYDCNIKILLADIHAYLNLKTTSFEILSHRTDIHEIILKKILEYLNINLDNIKFVQGTSYQLMSEYTLDVYRFNSVCKLSEAKIAGEHAVSQEDDPYMTHLLYPILQALDIEHLDCDVFFGDINQKGICYITNQILERLGYNKKTFFLDEIYLSLKKIEKISFLDNYDTIKNKINKINIDILFDLIDIIILSICDFKNIDFVIDNTNYKIKNIEQLKKEYRDNNILEEDIKNTVIDFLYDINKNIIDTFSDNILQQKLLDANYIDQN
jgi:tyrosyl-tRNA synthetase